MAALARAHALALAACQRGPGPQRPRRRVKVLDIDRRHLTADFALQQFVDQAGAAIGPSVGEKPARLVAGRQHADHVEIRASHELGVPRERCGNDLQLAEPVVDQAIDEVVLSLTGVGVERFAARIGELGCDYLDAPVARLAAPFAPVPYAPVLENAYVPDAARIEAAVRESEKRYRTLFENAQEGLAVCRVVRDGQGEPVDWVYLQVNAEFTRISGMGEKKLREFGDAFRAEISAHLETNPRQIFAEESFADYNHFRFRLGPGQVSIAVGARVTVNFEHMGKMTINAAVVMLEVMDQESRS